MTFRAKKWLALTGVLLLVCLSLGPSARPDQVEELAADVKALKDAGVAADEAGLLAFFTKHTVSDAHRRSIGELIKQLGDNNFQVREKATRELKALGPAARAALQQAKDHGSAEVAT